MLAAARAYDRLKEADGGLADVRLMFGRDSAVGLSAIDARNSTLSALQAVLDVRNAIALRWHVSEKQRTEVDAKIDTADAALEVARDLALQAVVVFETATLARVEHR